MLLLGTVFCGHLEVFGFVHVEVCVCMNIHPGQAMCFGHVCVSPPVLRGWCHLAERVRGMWHTKLWEESQRQIQIQMGPEVRGRSEVKSKGHEKQQGESKRHTQRQRERSSFHSYRGKHK